jgi:D-glycero-D-manno-heptose 1,7-bisphosphate phosphatase
MLVWIGSPHLVGSRLLFLDRDGVLNHDRPDYVKSYSEFAFYPDALTTLRRLRLRNVSVVIISNQSGLNRGLIKRSDFWFMHQKMVETIREAGGDLSAAFYCPHRPEERCTCRKPAPGLLLAASRLYQVALDSTFFIGDRATDLQAAVAAGSRPVYLDRLDSGDFRWSELGLPGPPLHIRSLEAVESILQDPVSML